jgi:hypothetical protein
LNDVRGSARWDGLTPRREVTSWRATGFADHVHLVILLLIGSTVQSVKTFEIIAMNKVVVAETRNLVCILPQ